jgi:primosomal protein N' (replication factor Y)
MRVCRVRPDVPAIDREFDYLVPPELADLVRVGAIVRVPLHGRRVRGWVIADAVDPEAESGRLLPLAKVSSAGPPAEVVELCSWAAWRYAGPVAALLGAASPPNVVEPGPGPDPGAAVFPMAALPDVVVAARAKPCSVIAWPPAADRRELVLGLLASEGSTLVVVPAAGRVPLLVRQLEREGRTPVVLHSDLPDAERTAMWDRARAGACVVVGGRLTVFAPVPDLEAIVVLDEGDEALKEERSPAWNARELAVERARRAEARVTFVSPVPTLEAEVHADAPPLRPPRGVERAGWPPLEIVDLRDEPPGRSVLTTRLATALREAVVDGRAVCVVNRKGRARMLVCSTCGALATCVRCDAAVAEADDGLTCPRCSATRPRVCQACHGIQLGARRAGVKRLAEELGALLPHTKVAEVGSALDVPAGAAVLVGTEAVLHRAPARPPVRLCAFLEFDQELLATRYRATEQALVLLARAARLVGPRSGAGRVLVQTRVPDHDVLGAARRADPGIAAGPDRARRAELGFPPFGGLAEVSGDDEAVEVACAELRNRAGVTVLGPRAAPARALVQAATVETLCDALVATDFSAARSVGRLRVEVEPLRV